MVRAAIQVERTRCKDVSCCWLSVLIGTGRMSLLRQASSIPLTSVRSVLERCT
jgi:hypothetical protein